MAIKLKRFSNYDDSKKFKVGDLVKVVDSHDYDKKPPMDEDTIIDLKQRNHDYKYYVVSEVNEDKVKLEFTKDKQLRSGHKGVRNLHINEFGLSWTRIKDPNNKSFGVLTWIKKA